MNPAEHTDYIAKPMLTNGNWEAPACLRHGVRKAKVKLTGTFKIEEKINI